MKIPLQDLESTKYRLSNLLQERTWSPGSDEEAEQAKALYYHDLDQISTYYDLFQYLRDNLSVEYFVEYASSLDRFSEFEYDEDEGPTEEQEKRFREYLVKRCGLDRSELP